MCDFMELVTRCASYSKRAWREVNGIPISYRIAKGIKYRATLLERDFAGVARNPATQEILQTPWKLPSFPAHSA